jgi:hypothetical protein
LGDAITRGDTVARGCAVAGLAVAGLTGAVVAVEAGAAVAVYRGSGGVRSGLAVLTGAALACATDA